MITAITPTGDRPLAFSLCRRWVAAQTIKPDQWIVIDDGKVPMEPGPDMDYIRRAPLSTDPQFTLHLNLAAALPRIKGDKVLILEDDEYYAPGYVEALSKELVKAEVAGIGMSRYYHLPSGGYFIIGNMNHASLAQTGFRSSFVPHLQKIVGAGKLYIDFYIWERARANGIVPRAAAPRRMTSAGRRQSQAPIRRAGAWSIFTDTSNPLYVGMKGLPGRAGIGRGHDAKIYRNRDTDRKILRQWVPKDYQTYLDILGNGNG